MEKYFSENKEMKASDSYYRKALNDGEDAYISSDLVTAARALRKNQTRAEKILWDLLRRKQVNGLRFLRQHPIAGYIVDFYCRPACLAIEIDGSIHRDAEIKANDINRQREIES